MRKFSVKAIERVHHDVVIEADTEAEAENKFYDMFDNNELESEETAIEELDIEGIEEVNETN